ncbi:MAG: DoxX family protein [Myxococcota bacterium]
MDKRSLAYWILTALFCAVLGFSGIAHFGRIEFMVESMTGLGYPVYFMSIIGLAKLLGVVALLVPGQPLLKEWAYAGFAFNLSGAVASHIFVGDPASEFVPPAALLLLGAASYVLRPATRRLAQSPDWLAGARAGDLGRSPA